MSPELTCGFLTTGPPGKVKVIQSCLTLCDPMDWSGQPFPSPGDLPNPGIEPRSPALQADSLPAEPTGKPSKYFMYLFIYLTVLNLSCSMQDVELWHGNS